jgi:hypothetical protein
MALYQAAAGIYRNGAKEVEPAAPDPPFANESACAKIGGIVVEVVDDVIEKLGGQPWPSKVLGLGVGQGFIPSSRLHWAL